MFGKSENEIRFADEILPGGQDEIGTQCRRNPPLRGGRGEHVYLTKEVPVAEEEPFDIIQGGVG